MFINTLTLSTDKSVSKVLKEQKKKQEELAAQLLDYKQSSFDGYLMGAPRIVSFVKDPAPGRLSTVGGLENFESLNLKNITHIKADCGTVCYNKNTTIERDKRPVIVFEQPVEIDQDAFEGSANVIYEFRGGIVKMAESVLWDSKNVVVRIAGEIPSGQPWTDGKGSNIIVEQILPEEMA